MTTTFVVEVKQYIKVTVDEAKFTEMFFSDFRKSFFPFFDIQDHVQHLAQLAARRLCDDSAVSFIEGYGRPQDMGIKFGEEGEWFETAIVEPGL